jgi:peroxiredoxin
LRLLYLVIASTLIFAACKPRHTESIICGQIDGYYTKPIGLYSAESVYGYLPMEEPIKKTLTDERGNFRISFNSKSSPFFLLITNDNIRMVETPTMVNRRDSVFVKTSIFNTSTPEFGGSNSHFNHFVLMLRQQLNRELRSNRFYELPLPKAHEYFNNLETKYRNTIDSIVSKHSISRKGKELLKAELLLTTASKRYDYLRNHNNETKGDSKYLIPSIEFYEFEKNLIKNTSNYWFLPAYSNTIDAMVENQYQHKPEVIKDEVEAYDYIFKSKISIIENGFKGIAQEVALAQQAKKFTEYLQLPNFYNHLEIADSLMQRVSRTSALRKYFNTQYQKVVSIKPGTQAPDLTLPDKDGKSVSLNQFRGKAVLIVFWGTWCPPCLASIPKYFDIQEQLKDEAIEFLFVSLEARADDAERWRDFIEGKGTLANRFLNGKKFSGTHIIAQGQFQNHEVQKFFINYAPSYVLIDKEGKIAIPRLSLESDAIATIKEIIRKE